MDTLRSIVVLVHIAGFAITFGSWFAEAASGRRRATHVMDIGLWISLASGLALAAPWPAGVELDYLKLGVKFMILVMLGAVLGVGISRQRKTGERAPAGIFWTIGGLVFANATIAMIW